MKNLSQPNYITHHVVTQKTNEIKAPATERETNVVSKTITIQISPQQVKDGCRSPQHSHRTQQENTALKLQSVVVTLCKQSSTAPELKKNAHTQEKHLSQPYVGDTISRTRDLRKKDRFSLT